MMSADILKMIYAAMRARESVMGGILVTSKLSVKPCALEHANARDDAAQIGLLLARMNASGLVYQLLEDLDSIADPHIHVAVGAYLSGFSHGGP